MEYWIIVNKTVTIIGESKEGTIVDGGGEEASVIFHVIANNTRISNLTVQNTASGFAPVGIIIADALLVEVSDCIIRNSGVGIQLLNSNNSRIERNKILQNEYRGIDLQSRSTNNSIINNDISNNPTGIWVEFNASSNKIYHNNFVGNAVQISGFGVPANSWDNGYPSGGNYWSDYTGADFFSGPDQNIIGSDGIGDEPAHTYDSFPFIGMLYLFWAGEWSQIDYYVMIASNSTGVSNFHFVNNTNSPYLKFDVEGLEIFHGFCRVAIPRQLLWIEEDQSWQVLINQTSVEPSITLDSEHTYMYFNYSHSTLTIKIIGTHAIPETSVPILIILMAMFAIQVLLTKKPKVRKTAKAILSD